MASTKARYRPTLFAYHRSQRGQTAVVWALGSQAVGPVQAVNVINQALRVLGVEAGEAHDTSLRLALVGSVTPIIGLSKRSPALAVLRFCDVSAPTINLC